MDKEMDYVFALFENEKIIDITHLDDNEPEHALELFRDEFGYEWATKQNIRLINVEEEEY